MYAAVSLGSMKLELEQTLQKAGDTSKQQPGQAAHDIDGTGPANTAALNVT